MQCGGCQEWEDEGQGTEHELSRMMDSKTNVMPAEWGGGESPWDSEILTQAFPWRVYRV